MYNRNPAAQIGDIEIIRSLLPGVEIQAPANNAVIDGSFTLSGDATCIYEEYNTGSGETTETSAVNNITGIEVRIGDAGSYQAATPTGAGGNWSSWRFDANTNLRGIVTVTARVSAHRGSINASAFSTRTFMIDATAPVLTVEATEVTTSSNVAVIKGSAADQESGIAFVEWKLGSGAFTRAVGTTSWQAEVTVPGLGHHSVTVQARDKAGNVSVAQTVSIEAIDSTPVALTIVSPAEGAEFTLADGTVSVEFQGTATDTQTGVASVEWRLEGQEAYQPAIPKAANDWSSWRVTLPFTAAGERTVSFRAKDKSTPTGNPISKSRAVNILLPFVPKDPQAIFSLANYLDELLQFASRRIVTGSAPNSPHINVGLLAQTFLQPFDVLVTPNARQIAERSVSQARICVEVLRRYFARHQRAIPASAETDYRRTAYQSLLKNLGTSYEELRLVRTADTATRQALANRLGIALGGNRPDNLDRLLLTPDLLSEAALEKLFGLADTTRDPTTTSVLPAAELQVWQKDYLREAWRRQDGAARSGFAMPIPVIDPDLVGDTDLVDAVPGNPAYDLRLARAQQTNAKQAAIKTAREAKPEALAGFDQIVAEQLAPIADLLALFVAHSRGETIAEALTSKQIALRPFLQLMNIRKLAETGNVLASEWSEVYAILTQVWKQRQAAVWREQEGTLSLSPDYFRLPASGTQPVVLTPWRADPQARRAWLETLSARTQQDRTVGEALQTAIITTEAETLPSLRDALVADLIQTGQSGLDSLDEVANRLSQELAIDCRSGGAQRITRVEQALETVQAIMFSARMGQFTAPPVLGSANPAAAWVLNLADGYSESKFDEEWQWIGAYATWRASMFVFGYPENYLLPNLRPPHIQVPYQNLARTAEFDTLIAALGDNLRLTASQARVLATAYLNGLRGKNQQGADNYPDLPDALKQSGFEITDQFSETQLRERGTLIAGLFGTATDPYLASKYLWEVFYFVPLAIGLQLQKSGQYLEALDWMQTLYAYNLPAAQRKVFHGLNLEANLPTDFSRADEWLIQGLNPHDIATKRAHAHTRYVLMALVRCFLDFADAEFTRNTAESLPRARALYVNALELLDRPEMQTPTGGSGAAANPFPPNPLPQTLRLHAELNLFKLRNGRNIAGLEHRSAGSATASASNLPVVASDGRLVLPRANLPKPTAYRYAVLVERAKQLVGIAQQIEAAFLAALEKLDSESYNLLKARQDMQLSRAQVRLQDLRMVQAQDGVTLADLQKQRSTIQTDHYDGLLDEGLIGLEQASLGFMTTAAVLHTSAAIIYGGDAVLQGVKAAFTFGLFGDPGKSAGAMASSFASAASTTASILETYASYERRKQEWGFQRDLARHDELIGSQQIAIAFDQVRLAQQEGLIAGMQAGFAEDTLNFLANKFTNAELYAWMSGILERIYSYFLQQATAMAQLAENQLAFERQDTPQAVIQADYWQAPADNAASSDVGAQTDRRGMTGSVRLLRDIYQLDQYAFDSRRRKLQLSQTFSLAQLSPIEFQRFRDTGRLLFGTPMTLFDRDFPGHYLRLIKRVRISVIALTPPSRGVRASLSCSGVSRVVVGGDLFQTIVVRRDPEQIAFTSTSNATGLFELEREDELLLPFESMGVDTSWELQLPKAANPFDYAALADVFFTVEYTALHSADYRQQVIATMDQQVGADRAFSLRDSFADQWYDLNHPEQTSNPMVVKFKTERGDFPPNVLDLTMQQIVLYFVLQDGATLNIPVAYLRFTESGAATFSGGAASAIDGVASTRRGNAPEWLAMLGKSPVGEWSLALTNALADGRSISTLIGDQTIQDILLVISYGGRYPDWPL